MEICLGFDNKVLSSCVSISLELFVGHNKVYNFLGQLHKLSKLVSAYFLVEARRSESVGCRDVKVDS
jgi:hypothetical protein